MTAIVTTTVLVPLVALCAALSAPRSTVYRRRKPPVAAKPRPASKRALSSAERQAVLDELHSERFVDGRTVFA